MRTESRLAAGESPNVVVERAELFLKVQKSLGIPYGGGDLQPVADDAWITQQALHPAAVVAGDACSIESVEGSAVVFSLLQDRVPAQAGLGAFKQ